MLASCEHKRSIDVNDEDVLLTKALPLHKQQGFWLALILGVLGLIIPIGLLLAGPGIEAALITFGE
jgi:uncharacterized membrane protein HdeD (DUF308 family)